jgi:hypothetical protein
MHWAKQRVQRALRARGYEIRRLVAPPSAGRPYVENPETGPVNMRDKLARAARGEPFEWPDILALNSTVARMIGDATRIVELGGGTGAFALEAAQDDAVRVTCSEFDPAAHDWANIQYVNGPVSRDDGPFDLLVAIEVVEHVADYGGFLRTCAALAPRALITTPNKLRNDDTATIGPPPYYQHVREWTAGEFYWVLRLFYQEVALFAMPDPYRAGAVPVTVLDARSPLIADCRHPV